MTPKERIETAIDCLMNLPETLSQKTENYKTYSRLLNVWFNRYAPRSNKISMPTHFITIL